MLLGLKTHHKATLMNTMWYWQKDGTHKSTELNRVQGKNAHKYVKLFLWERWKGNSTE